ncbi:MAG: hypothetical protein A3E26_02685 [Chlamydiae bacterium RIFCSPHIGHO2_12_FULL_49_32]|nr:MAG: hypothetical protein A3E26_02685 [Chlamydiae bacterium RIFCSPHIGHO2_12_FULL_49_32]
MLAAKKNMLQPRERLIYSPGLEFEYVHDMGSSTELVLQVLQTIEACPQKKVTVLMQNDPPPFSYEICKKQSQIICSLCGDTTCNRCSKRHSCAEQEEDTYMLMPLVNSPRTGVCGYLDFATFWARRPRDICSRGSYLNQEGVKNPFLV